MNKPNNSVTATPEPICSPIRSSLGDFLLFGVGIGSTFPVAVFFLLDPWIFHIIPVEGTIDRVPYGGIPIFLAFLSVISLAFASQNYERTKWGWGLLYAAGIINLLTLHCVVLFTGGSTRSLFGGYYLYTPAVIALTFGRGMPLYAAAVFSALSFGVNLWWAPFGLGPGIPPEVWKVTETLHSFTIAYFIAFLWQLAAAVVVARLTQKVKSTIDNRNASSR